MPRGKNGPWRGNRGGGRGGFRGKNKNNSSRGGGWSGGGGGPHRDSRWGSRAEIKKENAAFEEYYERQNIVGEEEKGQFWQAMRDELPNSFRFAGSRGHALTVQQRLISHYIPEITSVEFEGSPVSPPTPVQWYPDHLAWSMTTPKNIIRKFPPFASFQKFLVSENNVGNITRQEIVSMIPPLLLDIKPGMTVLDLCAAPGSKSAQIIEMVHGGEEARVRKVLESVASGEGRDLGPEGSEVKNEVDQVKSEDDWSDDGRSTGLLVANDVDYRRAQMLVHQCKRLNSPNLIVVNHDATLFPSIKLPSTSGNAYLKFDRILADVPCSGDGTTRKNPEIWKDWSVSKGLGLHTTQVRILVRALQMLKVGGRVVYSTCSLNPIENEAVVASAIDRCGGSQKVRLINREDALPGLKRRQGLKNWDVLDKTGEWWTSFKEMTRTREEKGLDAISRIVEGMFPPDASQEIPLENCMRIYPHLQDTGGFFIAVLEKQTEIKARPENAPQAEKASQPIAGSAVAIADEISSKPAADVVALETLEQAEIANPAASASLANHGNPQATARQNQENPTDAANGVTRKRSISQLDEASTEEADAAVGTKKLKTRNEEVLEPTPSDSLDRKVHYPPPPAAQVALASEETNGANVSTIPTSNGPAPAAEMNKKRKNDTPEESFIYLPSDHEELREIYAFYRLSSRFPRDRFMVRNPAGLPVKSIYYTSALAKNILIENASTGIKFVHCGVKMFVKQDVTTITNMASNSKGGTGDVDVSKWRIQSEGLPIIEGWVGKERIVRLWRRPTLRKLLVEMFPKINENGWKDLGELGEQVLELGPGCAVLRIEPGAAKDGEEGFSERIALPLWRGVGSLNLMLPKEERKAMLLRLYNDDSPLIDHSKERFGKKGAKEQGDGTTEERPRDFAHDVQKQGETGRPAGDTVEIDMDDDEQDGGVPLLDTDERESMLQAEAEVVGAADQADVEDNAIDAARSAQAEQVREAAPGVVDESEEFNKTV